MSEPSQKGYRIKRCIDDIESYLEKKIHVAEVVGTPKRAYTSVMREISKTATSDVSDWVVRKDTRRRPLKAQTPTRTVLAIVYAGQRRKPGLSELLGPGKPNKLETREGGELENWKTGKLKVRKSGQRAQEVTWRRDALIRDLRDLRGQKRRVYQKVTVTCTISLE